VLQITFLQFVLSWKVCSRTDKKW